MSFDCLNGIIWNKVAALVFFNFFNKVNGDKGKGKRRKLYQNRLKCLKTATFFIFYILNASPRQPQLCTLGKQWTSNGNDRNAQ